MAAIKAHKTTVDKTGSWDGPKAVADAPKEAAALRYMHAWVDPKGDADKKASYKFPHHRPGTDTPAVIAGVNNALARLSQASIPSGDRSGVEAHLRKHRKDAGLEESMSEAEVAEAVKFIKDVDDLKVEEAASLAESLNLQEKSNLAEWLESRLHLALTQMADDMFGGGTLTRNERKTLSGAIGAALDSYHNFLTENAPQLFDRRPWEDAPEDSAQPVSEAIDIDVEFIPLIEKAVRRDGTIPVKIIQPGWGSSGFYPAEVLKRDGPKIFTKETKMYWNHQTPDEEAQRPEGDLNNLAAVFVNDAQWQENGLKGAGLYADARVFETYQKPVDDLAKNIGVSIRARGQAVHGAAEGKEGPIIQALTARKSVDFVTEPGAGGEIITMFEAARTPIPSPSPTLGEGDKKVGEGKNADKTKAGTVPAEEATDVANHRSHMEDDMAENELKERVAALETTNLTLTTNNARLSEAMALRDAQDMVREALGSLTSLPEVTKARLVESLAKNPPMKDGSLDKEAFGKTIQEAVKAEVKYLEQVAGIGKIRGLGESNDDEEDIEADDKKLKESLTESFSDLGLSEKGAKIAAKGRT